MLTKTYYFWMPMNNVLKQASKVMMGKTNTTSNRKVCKICLVFTQLLTVRILTKSLILILLGFWTWGFLQLVKGTQKLYSLNVSHCSFFSNLTQRPPAGLIMPMQYHQSHFSYLFFVRSFFEINHEPSFIGNPGIKKIFLFKTIWRLNFKTYADLYTLKNLFNKLGKRY